MLNKKTLIISVIGLVVVAGIAFTTSGTFSKGSIARITSKVGTPISKPSVKTVNTLATVELTTPKQITWVSPVAKKQFYPKFIKFEWSDPNKSNTKQTSPDFNYRWKILEGDFSGSSSYTFGKTTPTLKLDSGWHDESTFDSMIEKGTKIYGGSSFKNCKSSDKKGVTWVCNFFLTDLSDYYPDVYTVGVQVGNGDIASDWQLSTFIVGKPIEVTYNPEQSTDKVDIFTVLKPGDLIYNLKYNKKTNGHITNIEYAKDSYIVENTKQTLSADPSITPNYTESLAACGGSLNVLGTPCSLVTINGLEKGHNYPLMVTLTLEDGTEIKSKAVVIVKAK